MGEVALVEDAAAAPAPASEASSAEDGMRMEGWLYLIRSNRFGLQYSRKRYFVLEDAALRCFKSPPASKREDPVRSAIIGSCIRVTDNGRESVHRSDFYIFTLYNASNHYDQLKLGARSSEEAARWISPREKMSTLLLVRIEDGRLSDWTLFSSSHNDPMASDVIAPSPWTIFGCKNGLRLFTEANDGGYRGKYWDDHPAIMAVGVVDANSEAVFQTLMSLGQSRSEWDFCLREGKVVEHLDGHTDIIHKKLRGDWLPWSVSDSIIPLTLHTCFAREMGLSQDENECINLEMPPANESKRLEGPTEGSLGGSKRQLSSAGSFIQLNDAADEFFDVPDESEYDQREMFPSDESTHAVDQRHGKLSTAAVFVKRLHDLAVQKRGYVDLQGAADADNGSCCYGYTLPKDSSCAVPSTWAMTDPTTFLIRGETYLQDRLKIKANSTLMQMVGADWIKSDKREDDLAGRSGGLVQVPGSTTYSLALYYMMDTPLEKVPLLERFVNGDDAFRNSRFKLIPYISKGSWIVKQSVGKKACLVGQALEINYFRGSNYLELGVDIGSSTVARGVVSLVLGYLNNLIIEMAFLVQGNTQEELPEFLLGTCRLNYLDASKAVSMDEC
ncbi:hypothetical protein PR202_gb08307 [Eleusine coracana subsp. coracana]|uniref:PH domain-containing protein n=1 Tax=Eleusine coracana subsp. coracana TaxID=191504 RepID=A0AAV5ECQ3_ELECO|nr:hypothetical protein PR202_gb08307 [Eleusine coracana subsp. coracana]